MNQNKVLKIIRIALLIVSLCLLVVLLAKDMAWSGKLRASTNFKKFTPFISILVPQQRVALLKYALIKENPVYFDVNLPRDFYRAELQFEFKNDSPSIIEVGAKQNDFYELKPLDNKILNDLKWQRIQQNGINLWQRQVQFSSIDDFLNNLPPVSQIAVYNYDLPYVFKMLNYQPSSEYFVLNKKIRESYEFYTYIDQEDMDFTFTLSSQDVIISDANTFAEVFDRDGVSVGMFSPFNNKVQVNLKNLPNGVYKIILNTDSLATTESIKTKQQYLAFVNNLNIVSAAELYTESKDLNLITYEDAGLQTVSVAGENWSIGEVYKQYQVKVAPGQKKIIVPKGNLQISGEGLFSFSARQYFNPLLDQITSTTDLNNEPIDYIIADYQIPTLKNDFKVSTVSFDLADKQIDNGQLRFAISVPDLSASGQSVAIKNLKLTLLRPPLYQGNIWQNLKDYLKFYKYEFVK